MPESFLGDGLIFEELLPLEWFPGALPQGIELTRLNADNYQLLGAESTLEEVRVSEAVSKEESSALVHELQRLEYKLNVLLRLTADLVAQARQLTAPQRVRLSSSALEWFGAASPKRSDTGLLHLYINRTLPQPLKIPCVVAGERVQDGARVVQMQFRELSDAVVDMLEKLIFRHHRRRVAGAKTAHP
jgi:Atypical PilZ domain, cyclic di-GMP receptor